MNKLITTGILFAIVQLFFFAAWRLNKNVAVPKIAAIITKNLNLVIILIPLFISLSIYTYLKHKSYTFLKKIYKYAKNRRSNVTSAVLR